MKNEIGRKITSLTLMTIMFAGGLTLAIPGFLPDSALPIEAFADQGTTVGNLYVSSTAVQGGQVIEIKVSDPSISATDAVQTAQTMDFNSNTLQLTQVSDGSWMAYVADLSSAADMDSASFQFGTVCAGTLDVAAEGFAVAGTAYVQSSSCTDPNAGTTAAFNVLASEMAMVSASTDLTGQLHGQVGHDKALPADLDIQSWPFIHAFDFNATNYFTFGDDTVVVTYGPDESGTSITVPNFVVPGQQVAITIEDNGLNIDPTTAETWTFTTTTTARTTGDTTDIISSLAGYGFGSNGVLGVTDASSIVCSNASNGCPGASTYAFVESGVNTGVFTVHDSVGESTVDLVTNAAVDAQATFTYGGNSAQMVVATASASASMDAGAEWLPQESATYTVTDPDMNRNSSDVETLYISSDNIIPTIKVGTPLFLSKGVMADNGLGTSGVGAAFQSGDAFAVSSVADTGDDSGRVILSLTQASSSASDQLDIFTGWETNTSGSQSSAGHEVLFYDICSIADNLVSTGIEVRIDDVAVVEPSGSGSSYHGNSCSGEVEYLQDGSTNISGDGDIKLSFFIAHDSSAGTAGDYVIAADWLNFDQGAQANGIYRIEAVETGPDTGVFSGSVTYAQMNTVQGESGAAGYLNSEGSDVIILLDNYMTGSSAPRVNYGDTDVLDGKNVTVGAQVDANTYSGVVTFDSSNYAVGDAATVTIVDADLNTDNTVIETYVGDSSYTAGTDIATIQCNDAVCSTDITIKLVEDGTDSDTFIAVFTVPDDIGEDIEIGYRDSRDAAGTAVVWYATSTIGSETGTIELDRQVYPVPFDNNELKTGANGNLDDFNGDGTTGDDGDVTITVTVTDSDFTDDQMKTGATSGAVSVSLITGTTTTPIITAGANVTDGVTVCDAVAELGPLNEVEQGSNNYEVSFVLDESCISHTVLGGQTVIQAKYADAAGDNGLATNTFDSSTFDLRNGTLTADKSVYIMGQDMVLTLTDEDLNLDSATAETYSMALIEWDSDANASVLLSSTACAATEDTNCFTNNPSNLEETGDDTGVFQTVTSIPESFVIGSTTTLLELGESITLTYRDAGRGGEQSVAPASADTVSEDYELNINISNFGASITLDKTVYDWTDTVNIEVVAPDHNKNSNKKESIGTSSLPVKISTRAGQLCSDTYTLKEDGEDTGTFTGYIVLTGLPGQAIIGGTQATTTNVCTGPESGKLQTAGQDDGVTVTYEYDDGSVALASAIIQWNFASIEWLDSSVSSSGTSVIRVVDPDEDLDDEVIDQISVDVYSDSDSGGLTKTLSETDEGTGIFEGTISFTTSAISQGNILRVSEGDTVTAEVTDKQLPGPDYTASDDLLFAATTTVGTAFPPLERAPASSARVVDASGNSVAEVSVDQQVQIAADVTNGQGKDQAFAYLVQVQDASGVTVSLSWLTGSLTASQSMTAAQSWTPTTSGSYTATVFVWESVSNPTALSPTVSVDIDVI